VSATNASNAPVRKWTAAAIGRSAKSMNLAKKAISSGPKNPIAKEDQDGITRDHLRHNVEV